MWGKQLQKELTSYSEDPTIMKMCKGQNIHWYRKDLF